MPQRAFVSKAAVSATRSAHKEAWFVVFVSDDYCYLAWCCLEIAIASASGSRITVVGSCKMVQGSNFFDEMKASVE